MSKSHAHATRRLTSPVCCFSVCGGSFIGDVLERHTTHARGIVERHGNNNAAKISPLGRPARRKNGRTALNGKGIGA